MTWIMLHRGQKMRYQTDYILGTDRCLFQNFALREPRHISDHYLVIGCLYGAMLMENQHYLGSCKRLLLSNTRHTLCEDNLFASLRKEVPKSPARERSNN